MLRSLEGHLVGLLHHGQFEAICKYNVFRHMGGSRNLKKEMGGGGAIAKNYGGPCEAEKCKKSKLSPKIEGHALLTHLPKSVYETGEKDQWDQACTIHRN